MQLRVAALALLVGVVGCSTGPKSSPDGTVESYYDAVNDGDFEAMVTMVAPETHKRIGSKEKLIRHLQSSFEGWSDFEVDVQDVRLNSDGKSGIVKYGCKAKVFFVRDRKLHPAICDDLWTMIQQEDGRWYIVLPESQRLKPML